MTVVAEASGGSVRVFVTRVNKIAELRYQYVGQTEYIHVCGTDKETENKGTVRMWGVWLACVIVVTGMPSVSFVTAPLVCILSSKSSIDLSVPW